MRIRSVTRELEARLQPGRAAPFPRASGELERKTYGHGDERLKVRCKGVEAADGSQAVLEIAGTAVARLALGRGRARLDLETGRGDVVPGFEAGDEVTVSVGGVPVLVGRLVPE